MLRRQIKCHGGYSKSGTEQVAGDLGAEVLEDPALGRKIQLEGVGRRWSGGFLRVWDGAGRGGS